MNEPKKISNVTLPSLPKKTRISQKDVPAFSLQAAMRIPQALADHFGFKSASPVQIAQALNVKPTSGPFRTLCGSSISYGLTSGGYNSSEICLTQLGKRVVSPTSEGDDAVALREAMLKPKVHSKFLRRFDNAKIPRDDIGKNILADAGVPRGATGRTLKNILDGAKQVGFLKEIKGSLFVDLSNAAGSQSSQALADEEIGKPESGEEVGVGVDPMDLHGDSAPPSTKVFISHGKNMEIVSQVKTMLNVADIEYEVAVEEESTAIPVPEKVFSAMRSCNSALICVSQDLETESAKGGVNQNVLIEIGAAFVLYEKRVVLLWDKKIPVPSNLQGLYRCEFEGNEISWSVGMKLLEAVKNFGSK